MKKALTLITLLLLLAMSLSLFACEAPGIHYDPPPFSSVAEIYYAQPISMFAKVRIHSVLDGSLLFLINNKAASFITGIVIPVDGGFSACSGV